VRVVAELRENPGAEDHTEAREAGVDLSVPVTAKMGGHHLPQLIDLGVQRRDQPQLPGDDDGVGGLHRLRLPQPGSAQHALDPLGPGLDVAAARPP
jgi:hypothetical protein